MKIIIAIIAIIVVGYVISARNNFESLRQAVKTEASNIGIYLEKRSKYLKDAMNIAGISHKNEVSGIARLTENDQFEQLRYLGQKYPDLMATAGYDKILGQAALLQDDIAASRVLLNSNINEYNSAVTSFPGLIIAKLFGYKQEKLVDEENINRNMTLDREEVDFSMF